MGSLHWLLLFAFYFFIALNLLLLLMVMSRLVRAQASINPLVLTAVIAALAIIVLPLVAGWVRLADFRGVQLLFLLLSSFALSLIDVSLEPRLPLPLDKELKEL